MALKTVAISLSRALPGRWGYRDRAISSRADFWDETRKSWPRDLIWRHGRGPWTALAKSWWQPSSGMGPGMLSIVNHRGWRLRYPPLYCPLSELDADAAATALSEVSSA